MRRSGLQAEVVLSLGLVMLVATGVLALVLLQHGESRLRSLLGRALVSEAHAAPAAGPEVVPGIHWWRVRADDSWDAVGLASETLDTDLLELAREARRRGEPLLQPGAPWQAIRFAAPSGDGTEVRVARIPRSASMRLRGVPLLLTVCFLALDVALFTGFGVSMLRRRVVLPLRRLALASRAVADGAFEASLPLEGPREAAELAAAFNDMSEALARRTQALEKAVSDLRDANSDLRRARAGLDRAERLASVGRLAAGVAHEVGNPMGALLAFLSLAERDPSLSGQAREHLGKAAQQGERVRRILRQLLEFSRPPRTERVPLDLVALAEESLALVRTQRRYASIRFALECDPEAPQAEGDPGVVAQILLNLVINAGDAVWSRRSAGAPTSEAEDPPSGCVLLRIRGAALDVRDGEPRGSLPPGRAPDAVECVVLDDGCGIAEDDRQRIFDPFFTTKQPGEGTGLGLANSVRLAEELGGGLELMATPEGFRTAFVLRLPALGSARPCAVRNGLRSPGAEESPVDAPKSEV